MYFVLKKVCIWLPRVFGCHCQDERSFHYKGIRFPICARCTGEAVGILVGMVLILFHQFDILFYLVMMIPMMIDGFVQLLTKYESTNLKRFITGMLFGYSLISLFILSNLYVYNLGIDCIS